MKGSSSLAPVANNRLLGKVAFITGGASGIGEATARLFLRHGATVIIADIQDHLGRSICDDIGSDKPLSYVHCDVTSDSDVRTAIDTAISKHGKLDIVFSNAGISGNMDSPNSILNIDEEDLKRVFEVNVYGAFLVAKHAAKVMIPEKKGSIIFTSSLVSVGHVEIVRFAYTASKHAVVGLMKNLCVEMGRHGIRVNCISPYAVATPMMMRALGMEKKEVESVFAEAGNLKGVVLRDEDVRNIEWIEDEVVPRNICNHTVLKDVAEAAMFLGSDESKYVSGLNLVVDGGYSASIASADLAQRNYSRMTSP